MKEQIRKQWKKRRASAAFIILILMTVTIMTGCGTQPGTAGKSEEVQEKE